MNKKIKSLSVLFLIISCSLFSQKKWSLDECITYAISHNLQLKSNQYIIDSNKETHKQSIRSLLPNVNGYTDYAIRYGRSTDPNTNNVVNSEFFSNNYSLEFDLDLFKGFQKLNSIKANKLIYLAEKEEFAQQKYLLGFRVMTAFYDILYSEGALQISKEQYSVSQINYDMVSKKVELGVSAKADLYDAESLLVTDELEVVKNENNLKNAKLKLIQEMNLEGVNDIDIQSKTLETYNDTDSLQIGLDSIFNKAKAFLPIIKANKLKVEAAKKHVKIARGAYYPSLNLFGGSGSGYFETNVDDLGKIISFREQFDNNTYRYIGLSLNIPISNGWSARSNVKQKKIDLLRADNDLKVQEQELLKIIQDLVLTQQSLEIEFSQSNLKLKSQQLAFTTAQKKYERGMISAIELFTAKNLYALAENENLQIKLSIQVNKKTLHFYSGLEVFKIE